MKIAIFTDTFLPKIDGVVTATLDLAKGLADKGHRVYIIAPKHKKSKEFKHKNIKVKRVSSIPAFFYPGFKFTSFFSPDILKYLKKEKIQLIHFQTPLTLGVQAILLSKFLKIPLVGTYHTNIAHPEYLKHMKINYKPFERLAWFYAKMFYNKCDLITCPSESTKKELEIHGFKHPIKAISNGINQKIFCNTQCRKMRDKYNRKGKLILFVGRIAHEKNIFYLLECFKIIAARMPTTRLLIVGEGPQMEDVKEKIAELKLEKNVILTGRINHEKFIRSGIFKACDIFITASLTETQGITMLEAQANGLPCVGVNARGIKNLIRNNYNGYLIKEGSRKEFAEKAIKLLSNKEIYAKMKKNTLKEIKKHNLDAIILQWEKEYKALIHSY